MCIMASPESQLSLNVNLKVIINKLSTLFKLVFSSESDVKMP